MGKIEGRLEVDLYHLVPLLLCHAHDERVARDARVINKDIDTAKVFDYIVHDSVRRIERSSIRGISLHFDAKGFELVRGLDTSVVEFEISEGDVAALVSKSQSYLFAYSTSSSRDQGRLVW